MSQNQPVPETLEVAVHETIALEDKGLGGQSSQTPVKPQMTQEEMRAYVLERQVELLSRYVPPHNKKSRDVTNADVDRVISEGEVMLALCSIPRGFYSEIAALAHSQIDDKDPLRFYVRPTGELIINPLIISHTKVPVFKDQEGCLSYPNEPMKTMVPRYNKVDIRYQTLKPGPDGKLVLTEPTVAYLNGNPAWEAQHECSHLNGFNLYDADFSPMQAINNGVDPATDLEVGAAKTDEILQADQ